MIPFFGVDRQYKNLREEILHTTDAVLLTGQVLDGDHTAEFEDQIAKRCDRTYAITVNSGTMGLLLALQSRDENLKKGIVIPAVSFVATLNTALLDSDADKVTLCDVDFNGLIDLSTLNQSFTNDFDTLMYVNLFGNTVDYDKFRVMTEFFNGNNELFIVEDAAQSFGASYNGIPSGKMGTVSVLSFDPTKNLNNYGSGGMILTDDVEIAECLWNYKDNGKPSGHQYVGTNNKMSEVDCAQMLVKLQYFDQWQARRTEIADYYIEQFGHYVDILPTTEGCVHAWSKFAFRVHNRDKLRKSLQDRYVPTKVHYEYSLNDLGISSFVSVDGLPGADKFVRETMSLPIYPELTDSEVEHIAESVKLHYTKS
jgi:dTDP-4-amino-4,6-dideoxygalactose transaminase